MRKTFILLFCVPALLFVSPGNSASPGTLTRVLNEVKANRPTQSRHGFNQKPMHNMTHSEMQPFH